MIREQFDIRNKEAAKNPRSIIREGFQDMLLKAAINAGVLQRGHDPYKRHEVMANHGYRKFFNSKLNEAGVKPIIKERLMGHRAGLEHSYLRPSEEELLNEFLKALPLLTISDAEQWKAKASQLQLTLDEKMKYMELELAALKRANETRVDVTDSYEILAKTAPAATSRKSANA